jgi:hypothetical protein
MVALCADALDIATAALLGVMSPQSVITIDCSPKLMNAVVPKSTTLYGQAQRFETAIGV